jgi:Bacteriophage tail sheath protein
MATFSTVNKAPGVYIQEITLPGPIAGVSTSIAALLGPAMQGPTFTPTSLTNIQQFWDKFGSYIEDPYRVHVTHAINGFFAEGGQQCYFVRVGTGKQAWRDLIDAKGRKVLRVTALKEGVFANTDIQVQVDPTNIATTKAAGKGVSVTLTAASIAVDTGAANQLNVTTKNAMDANKFDPGDLVLLTDSTKTKTEKATIATISSDATASPGTCKFVMTQPLTNDYAGGTMAPAGARRKVTTGDAADAGKFNPGDVVLLTDSTKTKTERAVISSISTDTRIAPGVSKFTLVGTFTNDYSGGTLRVADLIPGQNRIRVEKTTGIEPGSYISIAQNGLTENGVVRVVDALNNVLTLTSPLSNTYPTDAAAKDVAIKTLEFSLTIKAKGLADEVFSPLSLDSRHSKYFARNTPSASVSVALADPPTTSVPPGNLPATLAATNLAGGVDEDISKLTTADYHKGIDTLQKVDDVNLLCVPDAVGGTLGAAPIFTSADTQDIQAYMVAHCERMKDRFAILDSLPMPKPASFDTITNQRQNLNSDGGYAALYFPWISISNPIGKGRILVPPSGHVAGVYANNDTNFGVFRAPANESIVSALDLEAVVTDDEQGPLNEQGINVIRAFKGQGIKIWGARTIAPHDITAWRFVNVRRLLLFIEESIQEGTRFAVFEPNNLTLWQTLKRLVTAFLRDQWEAGALFGETPDKAFRVRVDETLNPPEIRALGQLIIEVTVVPTTPAEFIVFQVIQDPTGATLQEGTS